MPLASKFDITLFADDTYLTLTDNDLNTLQTRVNNELNSLNNWFLKHKLSLNYSKTNFLLINKTPYRPVDYIFQLSFNGTSINRVQNIKYLGVYIDELLNWSVHTSYLSLQLAKYRGLFCRLRNYVTRETLVTLYHSLIHSRVQYGVISWGNASNIYLNKIQIRMNNIVRLITKSSKYFSINPQYKMLKILKLDEIYKLELAKFMHNLHHNNLPFIFKRQFTYLTNWHTHKTRCADSFNYFLPRVKKKIFPKPIIIQRNKIVDGD